jgi:hypothetical protein
MEPATVVPPLLLAMAALGGFDTLVNHEARARLPQWPGAAPELRLHAMRSALYAALFAGHAAGDWSGQAAALPLALLALEIAVTTRDTVIEFRLRPIRALERVNHLALLLVTGALALALTLSFARGAGGFEPAALAGVRAWLAAAAALALASALRDALAARRRTRLDGPPAPDRAASPTPRGTAGAAPR